MFGLVGGLGLGLFSVIWDLVFDVWARPLSASEAATPRTSYRADVRSTTVGGLGVGLVGGQSPRLLFTEVALRLGGSTVRFLPLLETALDRQVLRQAGAVCQFRHAALQDRLADQFRRDHLAVA